MYLQYPVLHPLSSPHPHQRRFCCGEPEGHVHGPVHLDGSGERGAGLGSTACLAVQRAETAVTVRLQRAHTESLGQSEGALRGAGSKRSTTCACLAIFYEKPLAKMLDHHPGHPLFVFAGKTDIHVPVNVFPHTRYRVGCEVHRQCIRLGVVVDPELGRVKSLRKIAFDHIRNSYRCHGIVSPRFRRLTLYAVTTSPCSTTTFIQRCGYA